MPFISLIFIRYRDFKGGNKFILGLYWLLSLITIIIVDSASCIFIFILFTLMVLSCEKFKINRVPMVVISIGYIVVFILIIGFDTLNTIVGVISSMFGRSSTLTGRTSLWALAINLINQKPLLGYGYTSGNIKIWGGYFSSHNEILELMIHGGILSLTIFVFLMIRTIKNMKNSYGYFANIIFITLFLYFLIFLVETGMNIYLFVFIILANNCNLDIENHKMTYNNT